jgi:hypothetical protein
MPTSDLLFRSEHSQLTAGSDVKQENRFRCAAKRIRLLFVRTEPKSILPGWLHLLLKPFTTRFFFKFDIGRSGNAAAICVGSSPAAPTYGFFRLSPLGHERTIGGRHGRSG